MLTIIISSNDNNDLEFEINNQPNTGYCYADRAERVEWIVKNGSRIKEIKAIIMKKVGGKENIFSNKPPRDNGSQGKKWEARTNRRAKDGDEFVYDIEWIKDDDTPHTFDPIIAIRPKMAGSVNMVVSTNIVVATAVVLLSTIAYLSYQIYKLKYGK